MIYHSSNFELMKLKKIYQKILENCPLLEAADMNYEYDNSTLELSVESGKIHMENTFLNI